jgi:toxin FitB
MFLLDTNVISELRKIRPHGGVISWLQTVKYTDIYLPAIIIGELQAGIEITRSTNIIKANEIEAWLEIVVTTHNILPMEATIFRQWARLMHKRSHVLAGDAMIAATAIIHNLTVVTRNTRDFNDLGVKIFNPFNN